MKLTTISNKIAMATFMLAIAASTMTACKKNDNGSMDPRLDLVFYALSDNNQVMRYNAKKADMAEASVGITGLPADEKIISIDFRPATGQLYGLGMSSRLYVINLNNGNATALGLDKFTPGLNGTVASIDFNPTVDRIRLVTSAGQNLRLNPETGTVVATDGNINGGSSPTITSIAYTNSVAGASATELFDIDASSGKLYKQNPPNDGTLTEIGTINVNFTGKAGFDINSDNSIALAALTVNGINKLYTINTSNAKATYLAKLAAGIIDIAIPTNAVAYAVSDAGMFQVFNPTKTNSVVNKTIAGLGVGETIMGIDFRPVNGQLYGIATTALGTARLYSFNLSTGAATGIGTGFTITAGTSAVGFDFNPLVDRIRVVTSNGQNLRLNPNDGTIAATDANLNPGTPMITGAAYANNFAGTTSTALFVIDMGKLYKQDPPNNGTLTEIGSLGVNADSQNGFDIGGSSNNAFALLTVGSTTKVYTINTMNGTATAGVDFPNKVSAMAVGLGF